MNREWYEKKIIIVGMILFLLAGNLMFFPVLADAQEEVKAVAPSAVIEFEDEAVCVVENRGYFNHERTAILTIIDSEELFDEEAAMEGIRVTRTDAKGERLLVSNKTIRISEWIHQGKIHSVEICFCEDGNYTWEFSYSNLEGKKLEKISTGESVTPFLFTIDREAPFGTIQAISQEGVQAEWETLSGMEKQIIFSREKITIFGKYEDDIDKVPIKASYYKEKVSEPYVNHSFLTKEELDMVSDWKEFDGLDISKDQRSVVYVKLADSSGNFCYINTGVLHIDGQKPIIEEFVTQIDSKTNCMNGIFNGDVPISVRVTDPQVGNSYAGIQEISYIVYNKGRETQNGILYEASTCLLGDIVSMWNGKFVIDSQKNDSNDVVVVVTVRDMAGNITTKKMELKIDISRPVIRVIYDNNDVRNKKFFSSKRTATIIIQERNFRPEDVEIQITNTDYVVTRQFTWKKHIDSSHLNQTSWITQISYEEEGEYTFLISYCDLAGNQNENVDYGSSISPVNFIIDKTAPQVNVRYDNTNVKYEKYYDAGRIATIEILEQNLDRKDIHVFFDEKNQEDVFTVPEVSEFRREGNHYVAEVSYLKDGTYFFDIEVLDKAGNRSAEYKSELFVVDTVFPSVEIKGVLDKSSNRDEICVEIFCTDENYLEDQIEINWLCYAGKKVDVPCEVKKLENGMSFNYETVPKELHMDNHYKLQVVMMDKAGNCAEKTIQFSVNRYGSSFQLGEDTQNINHTYRKHPVDIIIEETNVDRIENRKIILFKNGETFVLQENKEYKVDCMREKDGRYRYVYTIFQDNFEENGVYQISVSSQDTAGNVSLFDKKVMESALRFGIDKVEPVLIIHNLESGNVYETDLWTVCISASDNFKLHKVEAYLDNEKYKTWTVEELQKMEEEHEELFIDIVGDSMQAHRLKIVCVDEAGNESVKEIQNFYVTTNSWVYLWKNKYCLGGIFVGVLLATTIFLRIIYKKRSNPLSIFEK